MIEKPSFGCGTAHHRPTLRRLRRPGWRRPGRPPSLDDVAPDTAQREVPAGLTAPFKPVCGGTHENPFFIGPRPAAVWRLPMPAQPPSSSSVSSGDGFEYHRPLPICTIAINATKLIVRAPAERLFEALDMPCKPPAIETATRVSISVKPALRREGRCVWSCFLSCAPRAADAALR